MSDFVDTSVFVRILTKDDPVKFERCLSLLERAERGETRLVTSESVVAEIVYVLSGQIYRTARSVIAELLHPMLENRGLTLDHKQSIIEALALYGESSLDFEDCLSVAHTRRLGLGAIYSYDRHFDRIPLMRRVEP
ncbi:MAG: PIN domain-containing protein [Candidatus Dormibacteraceae bacterium]